METQSTCDGKALKATADGDFLNSCGSIQMAPRPVKVAAEVTMEDGFFKRLWKRPSFVPIELNLVL
jgi:hypothetical protein